MRWKIRSKLIGSYMLLVIVAFAVSGVMFYTLVTQAVSQQAFESLVREGETFLQMVEDEKIPVADGVLTDKMKRKIKMSLASRSISASFLIVEKGGAQKVFASNFELMKKGDQFPISLDEIMKERSLNNHFLKMNDQDYLITALPMNQMKNSMLVLIAPHEIVSDVIGDIVRLLVIGFVITSALVVVLGIWFSRSLTRQVEVLGEQMRRLAKRDFTPPPVVRTGDELEDVSRTFAMMVAELKGYDQAQRRFLQHASHELKTPLMAIQGYAEGIKDGIFQGEEAEKGLDVIAQESTRLKRLVDELIYLSKLETMEDLYRPAPFEFTEFVEDAMTRVTPLAMQKGVELRLYGKEAHLVNANRDRWMQAMQNLLSNGIRHAHSKVEVTLRQQAGRLYITIRDDGDGFTGSQELIFERFYKGNKGDTGLGLAIVKAIVEKSNGTITANNHPQGGAEFQISLPMN
ncbi:sensor histidine kinase [Tumebacillus lipolyticus]|uniref:histidine kinase n=1 Tax=Tumebacillus lipolyticus TaxID=1280370 RepID=A0ABW4ZV80_9BACL